MQGLVTAGAGVLIQDLIDVCLNNCFVGLEEFSGIPGTVGGSVYINIHYFEHFLSDFLVRACVVERTTGNLLEVDVSWFNFGYDQSKLLEKEYYLVHATFALKTVDAVGAAYAKGRRDETIRHRSRRYPPSNTCGSFFRNFLDHEITLSVNGKKIPYVAYYLDKLGVKGELAVGNAVVSHQHANMLVTRQGATSADVIGLARKMQELVRDHFGMVPHAECQLVGFKQNPFI
jgi:UDP-N-acetylmuramate dehydrogenase